MSNIIKESGDVRLQRKISALVTVLLVLAVTLCLYATIQVLSKGYANIAGFMMFRVVTGSMEPEIPVGALLLTKETDIENIEKDDIVCFRTQVSEIWGKIVTHRVVGVINPESGGILLETKGDANPVADSYYVDETNLLGKVIWHTGDGSMFADAMSLFTSEIGFLGFIALPSLLLAGLILKNTVGNIRQDMLIALELERQKNAVKQEEDPLGGISEEEYNEMYERIRTELMEELIHSDEIRSEEDRSCEDQSDEIHTEPEQCSGETESE